MKIQHQTDLFKKLTGLVGVAGVSIFIIGFSAAAQSQGVLNPRPGIFNEPPYNRGGSTQQPPATSPSTTPTTPDSEVPPTTPSTPTTPDAEGPTTGTSSDNLVAVATANGSFKRLTQALQAAGLTETLQGQGPFTVFAPTDEAFAALPQDALQQLLQPENKQVLVKILTYHVVPGKVTSTDLKSGEVKTVEGGAVNVKVDSATGVTVNDAKVVQPDIQASNGVIHVIDKVILPPDL